MKDTIEKTASTAIVYIVGIGHSGSTLLDLLISAHSKIISVGEIIFLADYWHSRRTKTRMTPFGNECTCGAESIGRCSFWRQVNEKIEAELDFGLAGIDLRKTTSTDLAIDGILFRAIGDVAGVRRIVDSSKDSARLARLLSNPDLIVVPIFLWRGEYGVVNSQRKKGVGLIRASLGIVTQVMRAAKVLAGEKYVFVDYEDLSQNAEEVLRELMPQLGVEYETSQMDFSAGERHLIGGNRMRRKGTTNIRQDASWRQGLSTIDRFVVTILTWPAKLAITRLRNRAM